jgi:hypothetical protein
LITSGNPTMMSIYAAQCGKGHGCVFSDTLVGQIWSPINVSHTFLMTQAPPTRWDVWNTFKQFLIKKYYVKNTKTPPWSSLITQNTMEKYQNTLKGKVSFFFFVFFKAKTIICLYFKIKKTWISL